MKNVTQCMKYYDQLKVFYDSKLRSHLSNTFCPFPIFTDFPTAFLYLINYSRHS